MSVFLYGILNGETVMDIFLISMFLLGLIVGSFLNVVIFRFGFYESKRPRSQCQSCQHTLVWYELIPLLSYFFLLGTCRYCGSRLSLQYPLVELATGLLFLGVAYGAFPFISIWHLFSFVVLLVFWSSFLVLVVYDIRHTLVPSLFAWVVLGSVILVRVFEAFSMNSVTPLLDAFLGALVLGGFFTAIVFLSHGKGMGVGDIYIASALGVLFGVGRGIEVITIAFWIGALIGVSLILAPRIAFFIRKMVFSLSPHRRGVSQTEGNFWFKMKSEIAFVPFLFIAALVGMFTTISPFIIAQWALAI